MTYEIWAFRNHKLLNYTVLVQVLGQVPDTSFCTMYLHCVYDSMTSSWRSLYELLFYASFVRYTVLGVCTRGLQKYSTVRVLYELPSPIRRRKCITYVHHQQAGLCCSAYCISIFTRTIKHTFYCTGTGTTSTCTSTVLALAFRAIN